MPRYITLCLIVGTLSVAAAAHAASLSPQEFVTKASIANEFEIESSRLALEKSQNSDVKTFAEQMIDDHNKAGNKLKEALGSSDSHAQIQTRLDDQHQQMMDKLTSLSTDDFNRAYISMQTDAHKEAVSLFGGYSRTGTDKALKDFATEMLPTLQDHLTHAQKIKIGK